MTALCVATILFQKYAVRSNFSCPCDTAGKQEQEFSPSEELVGMNVGHCVDEQKMRDDPDLCRECHFWIGGPELSKKAG